jgi:hypothetical protein
LRRTSLTTFEVKLGASPLLWTPYGCAGLFQLLGFRPILAGMAKKPEPTPPLRWTIYKVAARQTWVGEVEATNEAEAIEKAAKEFKQHATKLMAVRRR